MKSIRIGSGAGYAGDRIEPAIELIEKGNLNYIIFECLAERTVAIGQQEKQKDNNKGYNEFLDYRMRKILPLIKKYKTKVITNMGAANPKAAAEKTVEIAKELKIKGLKIAYVTGDDIGSNLYKYEDYIVLENNKKLKEMDVNLISANAYIGAEGIIEALKNSADIIITGRVSDPALVIAPLVYEFNWRTDSNPKQMGKAVLAGHLLECAGQVTGGYYADPGYKEVPDLYKLGFPLIEIDENGEFIVTKIDDSGGLVSIDTCKEQIIYEIHNPSKYLTPDSIADFSKVKLEQVGVNRVKVSNATTHGKPDTLKVSIGYRDCFIGEGEISYGGNNCIERAMLAAEVVEKRLELIGVKLQEYRRDFIGYNSLYKNEISNTLLKGNIPEVRLRISGRTTEKKDAEQIGNEIEALYTNGPAGGGGVTKKISEVISICSIFIPRSDVQVKISYLEV